MPKPHPAEPPVAAPAAEWVLIGDLAPWDKNPRKNDHRVPEAMASLRRFGFCSPVVAWAEKGMIVAGHARLKAMRRILADDPALDARENAALRASLSGPTVAHVPVRRRSFRSKAEAKAYALRDNNPIGEWDPGLLASELREMETDGEDLDGLGWNKGEIDELLAVPDDDLGVTGGSPDEDRGTVAIQALVFGLVRLQMSEEDAAALTRKIQAYTEQHGTLFGFAARMIRNA